jgi:hypothetical protein
VDREDAEATFSEIPLDGEDVSDSVCSCSHNGVTSATSANRVQYRTTRCRDVDNRYCCCGGGLRRVAAVAFAAGVVVAGPVATAAVLWPLVIVVLLLAMEAMVAVWCRLMLLTPPAHTHTHTHTHTPIEMRAPIDNTHTLQCATLSSSLGASVGANLSDFLTAG